MFLFNVFSFAIVSFVSKTAFTIYWSLGIRNDFLIFISEGITSSLTAAYLVLKLGMIFPLLIMELMER